MGGRGMGELSYFFLQVLLQYLLGYPSILHGYPSNIHTFMPSGFSLSAPNAGLFSVNRFLYCWQKIFTNKNIFLNGVLNVLLEEHLCLEKNIIFFLNGWLKKLFIILGSPNGDCLMQNQKKSCFVVNACFVVCWFFFYILLYYFINVMIKTYISSFIVVYVIWVTHNLYFCVLMCFTLLL